MLPSRVLELSVSQNPDSFRPMRPTRCHGICGMALADSVSAGRMQASSCEFVMGRGGGVVRKEKFVAEVEVEVVVEVCFAR